MKEKTSSISIVMCTYNGARFVAQQLDSLLAQTRNADEIIVQDDGSTDGTQSILEAYAACHPEIHVYTNEAGRGVNANFFSAMQRATGDYLAISDQDDIWEPDKLKLQLAAIGNKLLCAGCSVPFATDDTEVRIDTRLPNYDLLRLLYIGGFSGHTMFFHRRLLELTPSLDQISPLRYYDVILSIVAAAHQSIVYLPQPLVHHRRHTDAASFARPTDNRLTIGNIARNAFHTLCLYRELRPEMRRRLKVHLAFLEAIRNDSHSSTQSVVAEAIQMLRLQTDGGIWNFMRLQAFCMKHCRQLFYAQQPRATFLLRLRGAYFPIACSEYFRYLSHKHKH